MILKKNINRRKFLGAAATTFAFTVVPRHVLGGPKYVAPSDKITLANIGCGTQGLKEMLGLLPNPDIQFVSVCDPERDDTNYVDWSKYGIRDRIRRFLENPIWGEGVDGIRCGREVAREIIETYYAKNRSSESYKGCSSYADFRELLEKEKDLDAVKVMTPDHLHATISIAAMKRGCHVVMHKPIANRLYEARLVIETARKTGVATHSLAWQGRNLIDLGLVRDWILDGAIGTLREVHNWTNRPVWPQWPTYPTERPPIPKSFDWDLWLGPVPDRPYHPNYTHAVFRGWYDFGGGSLADMGNYSLWPVFRTFNLGAPISIEANLTTTCAIIDHVSGRQRNDVSFPLSCTIHFKFPARRGRPPLDIFWYEGGMKPPTPEELEMDNKEMAREGMMFVGDNGKILGRYNGGNPQIIPEKKMREYQGAQKTTQEEVRRGGVIDWVEAFKGGKPSLGNFVNARAIAETTCLGAVALRAGRKIEYDSKSMKITNIADANKYLIWDYRKGWEL